MKTKKHNTSWMVSVALMAAIVIVLANTPLGMIQLPIIKATTVHIPVMGSIYILFAKQYAEAKDVAVSAVWGLVMGTVTASGIPEAIAAAILVLAIGKVLIGVFRKMNIGNV